MQGDIKYPKRHDWLVGVSERIKDYVTYMDNGYLHRTPVYMHNNIYLIIKRLEGIFHFRSKFSFDTDIKWVAKVLLSNCYTL